MQLCLAERCHGAESHFEYACLAFFVDGPVALHPAVGAALTARCTWRKSICPCDPHKICCKNFPCVKTSLDFPQCCFSRFSPLRVCLRRILYVMMHPRLSIDDSVPQEIIPPLYSIPWQKSFAHSESLLLDLPSKGEEPNLQIVFGNPNYRKWLIGHHIRLTGACPQSACMGLILHQLYAIGNFFVPVVDLGPWEHFFGELCS